MLATDRDTRRMNLREAWIREQRAATVSAPDGCAVARLRVGRQIVDVGVSTRRQHNYVCRVTLDVPGHQITRHYASRSTIDDHHVEQFLADVHRHSAGRHLLFQSLVSTEQQLLSSLTARVKSSLYLHTAERARIEKATVLARERHSLRYALVDYVEADLREPVDVPFARAKISPLNCVVEEAEDAVAVIAIVLCRVDPTLRRDRVRAAWSV